jgi:hypothetical protein
MPDKRRTLHRNPPPERAKKREGFGADARIDGYFIWDGSVRERD